MPFVHQVELLFSPESTAIRMASLPTAIFLMALSQHFQKIFQSNGYNTGIFGKWHLKSKPTGFDNWMVYPGQGHYYNPDYRTVDGMKRLEGYSIELTTDLSIDFMKKAKNENKPFMVMCQYKAPHGHWNPGPGYYDLYKDKDFKEPSTLFDNYKGRNSHAPNHKMGLHHMNPSHP